MSPVVALALVLLLIVANGLFVAAEFALVATRRGLIEERAARGDRRAGRVLFELKRLSFVLSTAQFGITATSLLVGFLADAAVGDVLLRPITRALDLPDATSTAVAVTGAFLISTMVQMLFGELAPKNLAISRPEEVSLALGRFMRISGTVLGPIVRVFDRSAAWVSRRALGVELQEELLGGHSREELSRIIATSGEHGALTEDQTELLGRAVELGDTRVSEVMVPRPDVVFLDGDAPLEELRAAVRRTGHSRFPVRGRSEDEVIGTVHIKDLLTVPPERRSSLRVADLAGEALVIPESEHVHRLLTQLRSRHRTFAVVVDEYGGTAGIVTIEDVVEELVGEIEDEFDRDARHVRRIGPGRFVVRGNVRVDHLGDLVGVTLPEGEYETIAGFVIDRLGHIPDEGETVADAGCEFTVERVEGVRVAEVSVRRLEDAP